MKKELEVVEVETSPPTVAVGKSGRAMQPTCSADEFISTPPSAPLLPGRRYLLTEIRTTHLETGGGRGVKFLTDERD